MSGPLSRPPLGAHRGKLGEDAPTLPTAGAISRLVTETRESLARTDGRRLAWHAAAVLPDFAFTRIRARLLSLVGCDIRRGVGILGHVNLIGPPGSAKYLRIGSGSVIAPNASFCLDAPITVGENVSIGPSAMLYTATHLVGGASRRMQLNTEARPIVIEDGAWIAIGALILPGVRVGRGAIVAAGAVVSKDVPENVLVSGNPAEFVENLPVN